MKEISPINFFKLYQKSSTLRIIDVRDAYDFNKYHLTYSANIPASLLYDKHYLFLNKRYIYYLICKNGELSKEVGLYLDQHGYKVVNVIGGLDCWVGSYHITVNF